jgi:hypothetical protein
MRERLAAIPRPPYPHQYAETALQYYLAARFSSIAMLIPVCGNLMHHALEFLLKAAVLKAGACPGGANFSILQRLSLWLRQLSDRLRGRRVNVKEDRAVDDFLRRHYGHHLKKLWKDFKGLYAGDFSRFDQAVKKLDLWEELRYPGRGASIIVAFGDPGQGQIRGPAPSRLYPMNVKLLDECFHDLWKAIGLNPDALKMDLNPHRPLVTDAYEMWNDHHF